MLSNRLLPLVRQLHAKDPVNLIHAHSALPCGDAAFRISKALGIPYVVSVHGLDAYSTRQVQGIAGTWCARASESVYRNARTVVCVSQCVQQQIEARQEKSCQTRVVYNGVNPDLFTPLQTENKSPLKIASVGNLIPIKGHATLLRAFAALGSEFASVTCDIVGDGPEREHLESLAAALGIAARVSFLGRKSRHEVAEALRRATLFALPSVYEAFGCVYLEAMATGIPAIGCQGQGIAEVIRHGQNGWLVGPGNVQDLLNALHALLPDRELRGRIGLAARAAALNHTLAHQAAALDRVFREGLA